VGRLRRFVTALAGVLTLCGLATGAAWAAPAQHFVEDATGDVIACDTATYTVTSGTIKTTLHEGTSASGNINFTGTITPQGVVAVDQDGNVVSIRGAFWFGGTANNQQGTEQQTFTGKLQIVQPGAGTVDSVNLTFHVNLVNGEVTNIKMFDFGSCAAPA
jgi:hypothetical protein